MQVKKASGDNNYSWKKYNYFWSSSESEGYSSDAYSMYITDNRYDGSMGPTPKDYEFYIRPCLAF